MTHESKNNLLKFTFWFRKIGNVKLTRFNAINLWLTVTHCNRVNRIYKTATYGNQSVRIFWSFVSKLLVPRPGYVLPFGLPYRVAHIMCVIWTSIDYIYVDIISKKIYNLFTEILPEILVKQFLIKNHSILKWHSETRLNVRL